MGASRLRCGARSIALRKLPSDLTCGTGLRLDDRKLEISGPPTGRSWPA